MSSVTEINYISSN